MSQEANLQMIAEGREAEIFAYGDGAVLRLLHSPDAHQQVEWESVAMEAARSCGIRVPEPQGVTTVRDRPGLIMERIDGEDMLTVVGKRPWLLLSAASTFGEIHARLHEAEAPESLPALKQKLRTRIGSSQLVPKEYAELALSMLEELPDGANLCHGDYHPGNIIWAEERPAVIDWTNVTRGDPAADYARTLLMLRLGDPPPGSWAVLRAMALVGRGVLIWSYRRAYRRFRSVDEALVARWEVPVSANRLVENIEPERPKLLRLLEERLVATG